MTYMFACNLPNFLFILIFVLIFWGIVDKLDNDTKYIETKHSIEEIDRNNPL